MAKLDVYACLGKETKPKETGQTSDALAVHFTNFIPWNPEGRQSMHLTSCFLCKRPGPRRTPGRTPDPLIKQCALFHACCAKAARRRPSDTRVNIRSLCTKHFAHTAKKGRARGMKRLPLKRCGARGTPRRAAIPWECAVSRGCHVKHREPVNELSESNSV